MSGPLDGVRILSFGTQLAGNSSATWMAQLGAEVIKVESLARPDGMRARLNADHPKTLEPSGAETTAMFQGVSRGVKSLGLDLKSERGRQVFGNLVAKSDAVLENLSRSAATSLGLAYQRLCEDRADIVLLSISGFGRVGPYGGFVAFGGNASSYTGLTRLRGYTHGGYADYIAASLGAYALVCALYERETTGKGCWIDLSQSEGIAALFGPYYLEELINGEEAKWGPTASTADSLAAVFAAKAPDRWVAVDAQTAEQRARLAELVAGSASQAPLGLGELRTETAAWIGARDEWQAVVLLQRAGVPAGVVHNGGSLWADPQLRAHQYMQWVTHPDLGAIEYPGVPYEFSISSPGVPARGPRLGEHTVEILGGSLGMPEAEINALVASETAWVA